MTSVEAIQNLRTRANEVSKVVTAMHGDVKHLGNEGVEGEIFRALFELTKQVEVVKKHLIRLEKGSGSTLV